MKNIYCLYSPEFATRRVKSDRGEKWGGSIFHKKSETLTRAHRVLNNIQVVCFIGLSGLLVEYLISVWRTLWRLRHLCVATESWGWSSPSRPFVFVCLARANMHMNPEKILTFIVTHYTSLNQCVWLYEPVLFGRWNWN